MANLWVRGVCDSMLVKVLEWQRRWDYGAVAATRPFLGQDGKVEHIPTQRAVKLDWRPAELDHLVRILKALRPEWELTASFENFRTNVFPKGRLLTGNRRLADMVTYKQDVAEILAVLEAARTGRTGKSVKEEISSGSFWDAAK